MAIFDESLINNWSSKELITNNKFIVTIGPLLTSFSKVTGIGKSVDYETRYEGGVNNYGHIFRKPNRPQTNILRLEKGVGKYNPLVLAASGEIEIGVKIPLPGTIILLDDNYEMRKMYTFDDITILKWEIGDLDGNGREILLDKVELMHSGLKMVKV